MATRKTKSVGTATVTNTVGSDERLLKTDASGKLTAIKAETLKAQILGGANLNALYEGVYIMYSGGESNRYPLLASPQNWPALQSSGKSAVGVALVIPGRVLIVAPTEAESILWSSAETTTGQTYVSTEDSSAAIADMDGKAKTAAIVAASTSSAVTNTASYAPGFCNLYSRVNSDGGGLAAGKWWLPSIGELMIIASNRLKINACLALIQGATQIGNNWYASSTEVDSATNWRLSISDFTIDHHYKARFKAYVRPVSEFIK